MAKFYCRSKGMRLLSIESEEENEAVRQALSESFFEAS